MGEKNDVLAPSRPLEEKVLIFYSYAYEDRTLLDRLEKHLMLLKYQGFIQSWHHREISAGREWIAEISAYLNAADIILLLISADFLASGYLFSTELASALQRHEQRTARVIPVLLRPVDLEGAQFSKLSILPTNARPVTSWRQRDEAFVNITQGIRKAVIELLSTKPRSLPVQAADLEGSLLAPKAELERLLPARGSAPPHNHTFSSASVPQAEILVEIDGKVSSIHPLKKPTLTIGRLTNNDIQVPSQRVSRLHARIRWENGMWLIEDAESLNGLVYQGNRVERHVLSPGDRVYLAPSVAVIYRHEGTEPPSATLLAPRENESIPPAEPKAAPPSPLAQEGSVEQDTYEAYYQEAIHTYRQVLHTHPREAGVYYLLGNAFKALKRYQEALDSYKQALTYNPQQVDVYRGQGSIFYELRRIDAALASYRQALRIAPQDAHLYWSYSITLYTAGHRAEAFGMYRQALTLDPRIRVVYQDGEHALPEPATYRRDMLEARPSS